MQYETCSTAQEESPSGDGQILELKKNKSAIAILPSCLALQNLGHSGGEIIVQWKNIYFTHRMATLGTVFGP